MNYSHFLFAQLFYAIYPNELEYDLVFGLVDKLYTDFTESSYNVDTKSEYDCMVEFLKSETDYITFQIL